MAKLGYADFELMIDAARDGDAGQFVASVVRSPAGEAQHRFSLPFTPERLENLVLRFSRPGRRTRRVYSTEMQAAREFGGKLFDAVFGQEVLACLRSSLRAVEQSDSGLRIKLRLQEVAELSDLPWELLRDTTTDHFFAQSNRTPIVRYLQLPRPVRPLVVQLPLRILVMISCPEDPRFDTLDVEHERARMEAALQPLVGTGRLQIDYLENATLAALQRCMRRNDYHVFHFIGHGGFDIAAQEGVLVLEDEAARAMAVSAQRIGTLLHDHRSLRLAILNSCEGARNSSKDPFAGVASTLIRRGIPAVVAMQFEISDSAAIAFAEEFYAAIADGYPVDASLAEARKAIYAQPNDVEWATPVLYLRAADGEIFNVAAPVEAPVEAAAESAPAAPPATPVALTTAAADDVGADEVFLRPDDPSVEEPDAAPAAAAQVPAWTGPLPDDTAPHGLRVGEQHGNGEAYEALWPIAAELPRAFDELSPLRQFHVLFSECRDRLLDAAAARDAGDLAGGQTIYRECLERADQLDVALLRADAYAGLLSIAERRGDEKEMLRFRRMTDRERERQLRSACADQIDAMIDEAQATGVLPAGLVQALAQLRDEQAREHRLQRLQQLGFEPPAAAVAAPAVRELPYELLWPLEVDLMQPFEELDRAMQFHVLFAECRHRMVQGYAARNAGDFDAAEVIFRECLDRAEQIDVPLLKADGYQGLMSLAERRGDYAGSTRYRQLSERERRRRPVR